MNIIISVITIIIIITLEISYEYEIPSIYDFSLIKREIARA